MLKCRDCFFEKLPMRELRTGFGDWADPTIQNENMEVVHIALGQCADAVIVSNGDALCETHLYKRVLGVKML